MQTKWPERSENSERRARARYSQEEKENYLVQKQTLSGRESIFSVEKKFSNEDLAPIRVG